MDLKVQKGFRTLKFIYSPHGGFVRAVCAALMFCIALISTGRMILAREVARRCWTHDNFELGLRRCSWYLRRGWLRLNISQDDLFDVTPALSQAELSSLAGFLAAREHSIDRAVFVAEQSFIAARQLETLPQGTDPTPYIADLDVACNRLLSLTKDTPMPAPARPVHKRKFPVDSAKAALRDFIELFPTEAVPWFVVSGTFLGLVREQGFIEHDYDIDFGVFADQVDLEAMRRTLVDSDTFAVSKYDYRRPGFGANAGTAEYVATPYMFKIVHASGVLIDLFIHHRDTAATPPIYWHGSSLHRWENTAFDLAPYQLYDMQVLGPVDADRYLTENYGDWRTPVTEFNCSTDTPNLALVPTPISVVTFLKRFAGNRHHDPDNAAKLRATLLSSGFVSEGSDGTLTFTTDLFDAQAMPAPQ